MTRLELPFDLSVACAQAAAVPGRVLPEDMEHGGMSTRSALQQLATYPGTDTEVFSLLDQMQAFLPNLPTIVFDGNYTVGQNVLPGKYRTLGPVDGCYWETLDAAGEINDNNFVNAAPQVIVTIRKSDFAFNSDDCGPWIRWLRARADRRQWRWCDHPPVGGLARL